MTRMSLAALVAVASISVVACADNILKERPATRTTKTAPTKPAFSTVSGESSVCGSYRRQLRLVQRFQTLSSLAGRRDEFKAKELTLNALIADACE